jgi:hypothetical protein
LGETADLSMLLRSVEQAEWVGFSEMTKEKVVVER